MIPSAYPGTTLPQKGLMMMEILFEVGSFFLIRSATEHDTLIVVDNI